MKTSLFRFVAASIALFALTVSSYGDLYFQITQNGSGVDSQIGYVANDNPTYSYAYDVTYPASDVSMVFVNETSGSALFMAFVDSSAAKGLYYIGYFPSGATCYVSIN